MRRRALLLALLAAYPASAATDAAAFIEQVGRDLTSTLAGTTTIEERQRRLTPFLARIVAVEEVARFCLGRFWRLATPAQQQDFTALFLDVLAQTVAAHLDTYAAGASQVAILRPVPRGAETDVPTLVRQGAAPPVHVTWVVTADPPRIADVLAEGISLRQTLRSDYTAFLAQHGGDIALFLQSVRAHTLQIR